MKRATLVLLPLLSLAAALTVGCGSNSNPVTTATNPVYSQIAIWSDREGSDAGGLWTINMDGSNPTMVPFTQTDTEVYGPSMAAGGTTIALEADDQFWTTNMSGSTQAQMPVIGTQVYIGRMSPDGQHFVSSQRVSGNYNVFVTSPDGSNPVNLTTTFPTGMTDCYSASFSADSKKVVFQCEGSDVYGLYTINIDGTGLATVYTQPTFYMDTPAFSPDGKTIYFVNCDGTYTLNSIPATGGNPTVLITAPYSIYELAVFNSNLYYTVYDNSVSHYRIFKANLDGTGSAAITETASNNWLYSYTY
jgi:Tol biopolymer transport system component